MSEGTRRPDQTGVSGLDTMHVPVAESVITRILRHGTLASVSPRPAARSEVLIRDQVATLPDVVRYAHCLPDGHWGYGFRTGDVTARDAKSLGPCQAGYRTRKPHRRESGQSRYASPALRNACKTWLGDMGSSVKRIPVAREMAFAMAAGGGTMGTSPTPRTP